MNEFKLGDVVKLRAGGPRMTINGYADGKCECVWFEGSELFKGAFPEESLRKA